MSRVELFLELEPSVLEKFQAIQKVLDHEEIEETLETLLRLGEAAIALTSVSNPEVRLFTREKTVGNLSREVNCPYCTKPFVPIFKEDEGYRELAVRLK
jgi:hypothetical protein